MLVKANSKFFPYTPILSGVREMIPNQKNTFFFHFHLKLLFLAKDFTAGFGEFSTSCIHTALNVMKPGGTASCTTERTRSGCA